MSDGDSRFDDLAEAFERHYGTLRGVVRRELVAEQVAEHLPAGPLEVVDVGGGAGHQALRLARMGHRVTVVDPSPEMLGRARDAVAVADRSLAERVRLVQATAEEATGVVGGGFDAVLCHAVLPYVEDARALVRALVALVRTGGLVSLLHKNADALALRPALEGRWLDALPAFDADRDIGGLGIPTRAHRRADIEAMAAEAGLRQRAWYGIRVLTDHLRDEPPGVDLEHVLAAERRASTQDPYRSVGRLIHGVYERARG